MDDKEQSILSRRADNYADDRAWRTYGGWTDEEFRAPAERSDGNVIIGVTTLQFILTALRRKARLLWTLALVGLLAGVGYFVDKSNDWQATVQVVIANPPGSQPGVAVVNDQGIVQSVPVAAGALKKLGMPASNAPSFLSYYTTTVDTDQILDITVTKAPSSSQAVSEANALASSFLSFQSNMLQNQQALVDKALDAKVSQAQQTLDAVNKQVAQVAAEPTSDAQKAKLSALRAESSKDTLALTELKTATQSNEALSVVTTTTAIKDSQPLGSATPSRASRKKKLLEYGGGGALGFLALGFGIVVIGAVASDKLRRREDIARAFGAPVRLSVGPLKLKTRGPWQQAVHRSPATWRLVTHLEGALRRDARRPAALAVVPVDDLTVPAVCLASLAVSCSEKGQRVVVIDLCEGAPAGRLLGTTTPGVQTVNFDKNQLVVVIPEPSDVLPVGPLGRGERRAQAQGQVMEACRSADVMLTLVALDPALGGDHLSSWTRNVVAVVTTGRSTADRIHAVGEMIRLSGLPVVSAVVVGADKGDESLGIIETPVAPAAHVVDDVMPANADRFRMRDGRGPVSRPNRT